MFVQLLARSPALPRRNEALYRHLRARHHPGVATTTTATTTAATTAAITTATTATTATTTTTTTTTTASCFIPFPLFSFSLFTLFPFFPFTAFTLFLPFPPFHWQSSKLSLGFLKGLKLLRKLLNLHRKFVQFTKCS